MKIKRTVCAALFAFAVAAAHAQGGRAPAGPDVANLSEAQIKGMQVPDALYRLAAIYKQKGDLTRMTWALRQLSLLRPNAGELKLALASVYAAQAYGELIGGLARNRAGREAGPKLDAVDRHGEPLR